MRHLKNPGINHSFQKQLISLPIGWLLVVICLGYFFIQIAYYQWILSDNLLENYYQSIGSDNIISSLIDMHKSRRWIYIILHQVLVLSKITMVFLALFIGGFLTRSEFKNLTLLRVVLISEILVLSFELFKLKWLLIQHPQNLNQVLRFSPLSLVNIVNLDSSQFWLWYLISYINAFEIVYVAFLCLVFQYSFRTPWRDTLRVVPLSYVAVLLIWLCISSTFLFYAEVAS